MTVLPVPGSLQPSPVTRADGARIIARVPLAGAIVGSVVVAVAWAAHAATLPTVLVGALAAAAAALLTRGMHLDGFADCVDGLGSYGPPERAREIMRQGTVGPFGAAALALLLIAESAAVGALADREAWLAIGVAVGAARVAAVLGCRRGWSPSNPDGFGALTAGTQGLATQGFWAVAALAAAVPAVPGRPWQGPLAVAVGLLVAALAMRHCVRRFGGMSGDVLGFGIELAAVVALIGLCAA
ncbi:adenosylcobinamide-GDP ribazoletransferase [Tsukamurella tyrosinosolvens]|uniref:adenosylcobinamide-GDP ribazoletransferase n=1 Tax=Tsukamurella tyrosinosolvens TaxID=57704 RepID=UPI0007924A89|nr:adenosylcobinamide-GDP ribazoletransferase [Tsukamurella tyrosinosolvens]KXP04909.1 adenosylcobinamide-GDP ribazoletransferase [Tsukamurella tyrosinosolvens]KZL98956.1 adenosylcobinamide-GDP ribazoletransferase [Tsukamurella tyrosinosolvens]MCA4995673.1 adenosylcobinamide-GDP ribazoletransferase [Tsukamurella tyrosinosolvens]WEL91964.1 adenosylcobinamide-GDP ribazoletransferase [Tsukamurella tyrosinosolvens]